MEIFGGLLDHQVLQRNRKNVSETTITGKTNSPGTLEVKVTKDGRAIPGFNFSPLAKVKAGKFTVKLVGIPVGGPYQITLKLVTKTGSEVAQFSDILVGDVWILGGQSNMEGLGLLMGAAKPQPQVRAFYMHDQWGVAKDPIHNLCDAVDTVHPDLHGGGRVIRDPRTGTGPGVGFGQAMRILSGVPQGLIACAHGGTSMGQWDPALKGLGTKSLYGATLRRFHKNGAHVAGVIWYQGCSDTAPECVPLYVDRMKRLVASFRRDLKNPTLPFVLVQIATVFPTTTVDHQSNRNWNTIQDIQRRLPKIIKHTSTVPAIDLALDDCIHICGSDQNRLGRRLAEATWTLLHGPKGGRPPIELKSIERIPSNDPTFAFRVRFDHVEGKLIAPGRPAGFKILTKDGHEVLTAFRIELDEDRAIVRTFLTSENEETEMYLSYGYGVDAYCNITDQADRSLPVFAPVCILKNNKPQKLIKTVRISKVLPGAGKLEKVQCPKTKDRALDFKTRTFSTTFYNLHEELQNKTDDAMVFYAATFECEEAMKLEIGFGYDGPVKMWVDGKQVYHDPDGINPMIVDQFKVPYRAGKGRHEIIVAFSANFGKAWGISLRLHRTDLTARQLKAGPEKYKLPKLLD